MPEYKEADFSRFHDLSDIPEWARLAVAEGLLVGYPDGTLRPNDTVTRAEALSILCRLFVQGLGW